MVVEKQGSTIKNRIIPFGEGSDTFTRGTIYASTLVGRDVPTGLRCVISNNFGIPNYNPRVYLASYEDIYQCNPTGAVSYQSIQSYTISSAQTYLALP